MARKLSLLNLTIIVTLFCWSVWGILDKKALDTSSHAGIMIRLYAMALWQVPATCLYMYVTGQADFNIASGAWLWTAVAAIFQVASLASYLVAMTITDASLVLSTTAAYPVVTQFLAFAFLGEKLLPGRTLGTVAIAAGVFAVGATFDQSDNKLTRRQKILLAVCICAATFGWGIWGIFDKKAIEFGTPVQILLAESIWEIIWVVLGYAVMRLIHYDVELKDVKAWLWTTLSAICLFVGRFTFLVALSLAAASYVIAITGCYPLFMYFMALFFLKEKFSKLRLLGILLIVAGGIAVQMSL